MSKKKPPTDDVFGDVPPEIFFTPGDIAWIERYTKEQFSDKDRADLKVKKFEKKNEEELEAWSKKST